MNKKLLKIAAFVTATVLTIGLAFFANALVGNPVSKYLVKKSAQSHIEKTYPNENFYIKDTGYSFKENGYYVNVTCDKSLDKHFRLSYNSLGKLVYDSYEHDIKEKHNAVRRVFDEYWNLVKNVTESPTFPFDSDIGYGELFKGGVGMYDFPIDMPNKMSDLDFEIDKIYDVRALGKDMGIITLYVEDDSVTEERFAQILLEVKNFFDYNNVPFYAVNLVLEPPRDSDGKRQGNDIRAEKICYSDITDDEGYMERVREAIKATAEFYDELNDKK